MPSTDLSIVTAASCASALKLRPHASRLCALYGNFLAADRVRDELLGAHFLLDAITLRPAQPGDLTTELLRAGENKRVLTEVLADSAFGAALGVVAGVLGTIVLLSVHSALFLASPILAPVALMVNFASVGALLGGAFGADKRGTHYSTLVDDEAAAGAIALLVTAANSAQRAVAKIIIRRSLMAS